MINRTDKLYAPLSEFELKNVRWLWGKFLGAGIITVLDGDPGVGKSYLAMNIAAEFSRGGSLPNQPKLIKRDVLYITSEDDPSFTVGPRIDVIGMARVGLVVAEHPEDPDLKVVAHSKHNLSPKFKSLGYRIIGNGEDRPPTFKWEGEIDIDANELIVGAGSNSVKVAALEFLKSELANGEKPQAEIIEAASRLNISERTLNRAKAELNVASRKSGKVWLWSLPINK